MKKSLFLIGVALLGLANQHTVVASPVTWNAGDVLIGFESTSDKLDYLVDLGPLATLAAELSGNTFSPVNLNADLTNVFGSGWFTNSTADVQWGLFGITSAKTEVLSSVPSGSNPLPEIGTGGLGQALANIEALGGKPGGGGASGYNGDIANGQGLTVGVEQFVGTRPDTTTTTWTGNSPSVQPFGTYNVTIENGVAGNLDIYGITSSSQALLGRLTISTNGVISAVPEPSTYTLFGLAALVLMITYRRQRRNNA